MIDAVNGVFAKRGAAAAWVSCALILTSAVIASPQDTSVRGPWETRWRVRTDVEYNDNVFRLSPRQEISMNARDSSSEINGRYDDMESPDDISLEGSIELLASAKDLLLPRTFAIWARTGFTAFRENPVKNHLDLRLGISQKVSKHGKVSWTNDYIPYKFVKNYLADALDSTGRVSQAERVYREGAYSEWESVVGYDHGFPGILAGLSFEVSAGYRAQWYLDPFPGRTERTFIAGAEGNLGVTDFLLLGVGYRFAPTSCPVTPEVMILDEPEYQMDFNNDRDFADENRRTVQTVDRSNRAHEVTIGATVTPLAGLSMSGVVELFRRGYTSNEPIDPDYSGRDDNRTTMTFGVGYHILSNLQGVIEYRYLEQKTNRGKDPASTGEISDYTINSVRAGVSLRF